MILLLLKPLDFQVKQGVVHILLQLEKGTYTELCQKCGRLLSTFHQIVVIFLKIVLFHSTISIQYVNYSLHINSLKKTVTTFLSPNDRLTILCFSIFVRKMLILL